MARHQVEKSISANRYPLPYLTLNRLSYSTDSGSRRLYKNVSIPGLEVEAVGFP